MAPNFTSTGLARARFVTPTVGRPKVLRAEVFQNAARWTFTSVHIAEVGILDIGVDKAISHMTEREKLTCPKTGKPIDRKWISKWSDSLYLAFCDCGKVHELVRVDGETVPGKAD